MDTNDTFYHDSQGRQMNAYLHVYRKNGKDWKSINRIYLGKALACEIASERRRADTCEYQANGNLTALSRPIRVSRWTKTVLEFTL
ncbi:hypothetical protein HHJ81_06620 [Mobiluncus mulieris]|uniref:hypothetical protein n=1 Tax=Mobiluncus mulieris TaxID=2052 RepID=UPI0014702F21|nr:hypothetical protein [Mobiluncus mulieris]MCU9995419.1 hypothetical protein [Mobiluncus mulieris]NMW60762.1 hypothetical protein [Mobiluncus mulieris]